MIIYISYVMMAFDKSYQGTIAIMQFTVKASLNTGKINF